MHGCGFTNLLNRLRDAIFVYKTHLEYIRNFVTLYFK